MSRIRAAYVEERFHLRLLGARPDLLGAGAAAEHERERADDNRFAGTGLAGQHVEAGIELDLQLVDEDEVLDAQRNQHGARSITRKAPGRGARERSSWFGAARPGERPRSGADRGPRPSRAAERNELARPLRRLSAP